MKNIEEPQSLHLLSVHCFLIFIFSLPCSPVLFCATMDEEAMPNSFHSHAAIILFLFFISVNLFILDLKVFTPASMMTLSDVSVTAAPVDQRLSVSEQQVNIPPLSCPAACTDLVKEATAGMQNTRIGSPENSVQSGIQVKQPPNGNAVQKEYYIPLGSGNTAKTDWDDLTATETLTNPETYGNIREILFLASLKNPTQNGETKVRLYNVTDKHPVWNSEVAMNGPVSQTITSGNISFDNGTKLYRVQMKNSMGYQVNLENARIRIVAE